MATSNEDAPFNSQETKVPTESKITTGEYGLYMIYSSNPLLEIRKFCDSYSPIDPEISGKHAIEMLRIDYAKNTTDPKGKYKETNRTVAVVQNAAANALKEDGYHTQTGYDFVIVPYSIRDNNHPPKGCTANFFISIPADLDHEEAKKQLHLKFESIVKVGFLGPNEYTVIFPPTSREAENTVYRGHAIVTFSNKVDPVMIASIKVILDMTRWYLTDSKGEPKSEFCHLAWCRATAIANLTNRRPRPMIREPEMKTESRVKTVGYVAKPKSQAEVSGVEAVKPKTPKLSTPKPVKIKVVGNPFDVLSDE